MSGVVTLFPLCLNRMERDSFTFLHGNLSDILHINLSALITLSISSHFIKFIVNSPNHTRMLWKIVGYQKDFFCNGYVEIQGGHFENVL
jgi:hypothetical protein